MNHVSISDTVIADIIYDIHFYGIVPINCLTGTLLPPELLPYSLLLNMLIFSHWMVLDNQCILTHLEEYYRNSTKERSFWETLQDKCVFYKPIQSVTIEPLDFGFLIGMIFQLFFILKPQWSPHSLVKWLVNSIISLRV